MGNSSNKKVANTRSRSSAYAKPSVSKTTTKVVKKSKKKNDTGRIAFLLFIVVLFIVILISTVFSDTLRIINNKRETQELKIKRDELRDEEKALKSEVIKLQDPEYKARYAREKYYLTTDGEKILTIIDSEKENIETDKDDQTTKKDNSTSDKSNE